MTELIPYFIDRPLFGYGINQNSGYFKSISPGISQIKFNRDSEMVDPDGNQIQIRHRGIGFIDAK